MSQVNVEDVLAFLALFGVCQLSEEVQKEEVTELFEPCYKGQLYFHCIVPYIQRYLVTYYPEVQDTHHEAGMANRLKDLLFVKVSECVCVCVCVRACVCVCVC